MINGYYTKNELMERGYKFRSVTADNIQIGPPAFLIQKKNGIINQKKVFLLNNIAIKERGSDYFTIPSSVYCELNHLSNGSTSFTLLYEDGNEKNIKISDIEEFLSKPNSNRPLEEVWGDLAELDRTF